MKEIKDISCEQNFNLAYELYWIEEYEATYRSTTTHAFLPDLVDDGKLDGGISMCKRINMHERSDLDGGYHTTNKYDVECKFCEKAILKYELNKILDNRLEDDWIKLVGKKIKVSTHQGGGESGEVYSVCEGRVHIGTDWYDLDDISIAKALKS